MVRKIVFKIGVRAHDLGCLNEFELASKIKDYDFDGIQLVLKKAIDHSVDINNLDSVKNALSNTKIFMVGAYFNMIDSNKDNLDKNVNYFKEMIDVANSIKCKYVATETGYLSNSPKEYTKDTTTKENVEKVINLFKEFCSYGKTRNVMVLAEGAFNHTASTPDVLNEIVEAVNDNLGVIVDIYNYLNLNNYNDYVSIFKRCIELFKDNIKIIHLKDFVIIDSKMVQVGLGKGLIDYKILLKLLYDSKIFPTLIFEGVKPENLTESLHYIKSIIRSFE
jgi:sugar phosphate isomerase/epimerase